MAHSPGVFPLSGVVHGKNYAIESRSAVAIARLEGYPLLGLELERYGRCVLFRSQTGSILRADLARASVFVWVGVLVYYSP